MIRKIKITLNEDIKIKMETKKEKNREYTN